MNYSFSKSYIRHQLKNFDFIRIKNSPFHINERLFQTEKKKISRNQCLTKSITPHELAGPLRCRANLHDFSDFERNEI